MSDGALRSFFPADAPASCVRGPGCCAGRAGRCGRAPAVVVDRPNDIRILDVRHEFEDFQYRAPYQFGGRSVDRVTLLNVTCRVRTNGGREVVWLRLDDARERLGVPGRFPGRRPRRDADARRPAARRHRGLRRQRASDRSVPGARTRVPARRRRRLARAVAADSDSQAVHAGGRERVRRGDPRRLRQSVRPERVRDLWP